MSFDCPSRLGIACRHKMWSRVARDFPSSSLYCVHRVPLQTLQKCGESLERMFGSHLKEISDAHHSHSSLEPPPSLPPTAKLPEFSRSQSLFEFKMIPSPPPTCNNLLETIQAKPLPPERLPPAKRQCNRGQRGRHQMCVGE